MTEETLPQKLRVKADMITLCERIQWGSETSLMREAADRIEELEAKIEAQRVTQTTLCKMIAKKNQCLDSIDTELLHSPSISTEFKKLLRTKIYNEMHGETNETP